MDKATEALIVAHIEKAEKKLSVAQKLFDEGEFEDTISRVYYAVYHATQALLITEGQEAETHRGVIPFLASSLLKQAGSKRTLAGI